MHWIDVFVDEKGYDLEELFEVDGPTGTANIVPLGVVVDAIRAQGWDAAIDGMKIPADELTITNLELGYYEPPMGEAIASICPCYVVTGFVGPTSDPTPVEFCVWADGTMPQGSILSPADSSVVAVGEEVCFESTAQGGTSPWQFEWFDEAGQSLGVGATVCTTLDLPPASDEAADPMRTIEMVVTDAAGRQNSAYVRVILDATASVDPVAEAGRMELRLAGPNPFGASTTIAYAIPGSKPQRARVVVLDAGGRSIRTLVDATQQPDQYQVTWDGQDDLGHRVASGAYFVRMDVAGEHASIPVTVLRR